jgi:general secretion pathway protein A
MTVSSSASLQAEEGRVYLDFYALSEPPFAVTPDPAFLYLSETHQAALEKLLYGIGNRLGFLMLTGEVGTGKTTLCRHLLDLMQNDAETVYLVNPSLTGKELMAAILDDLGLAYPKRATRKTMIDLLNRYLLERDGRRPVVLIIDDAQAMATEALENLRLLSNLETDKTKLLQILLVGQPELYTLVGQPQLRQLHQRIALHCRLELLNRREVEAYISRRLATSGNHGPLHFTPRAIDLVRTCSRGIPRLINKICDLALVAGYVANDHAIKRAHVKRAIAETGPLAAPGDRRTVWRWRGFAAAVLVPGVITLVLLVFGLRLLE